MLKQKTKKRGKQEKERSKKKTKQIKAIQCKMVMKTFELYNFSK